MHGHPPSSSTYEHQQQTNNNNNNNNNNSSQIPVIAAAAQAILEQNNATAAALAANAFYRYQQQNPSMPFHQTQSMVKKEKFLFSHIYLTIFYNLRSVNNNSNNINHYYLDLVIILV